MAGGLPNRQVSKASRGKYNNKVQFASTGMSARNKRRLAKKQAKKMRQNASTSK